MVDHSCDEKTEESCAPASSESRWRGLTCFRRGSYNKFMRTLRFEVDGSMPLREAHKIAEVVHNSIEKTFPKVKHIMVCHPEIDRK